ncbi:MAG: hypothetical protein FWC93_07695 [Defluviitaleaceae bacterium]|nr:hypothetical protein [Defluviitaleaceae bacterium]
MKRRNLLIASIFIVFTLTSSARGVHPLHFNRMEHLGMWPHGLVSREGYSCLNLDEEQLRIVFERIDLVPYNARVFYHGDYFFGMTSQMAEGVFIRVGHPFDVIGLGWDPNPTVTDIDGFHVTAFVTDPGRDTFGRGRDFTFLAYFYLDNMRHTVNFRNFNINEGKDYMLELVEMLYENRINMEFLRDLDLEGATEIVEYMEGACPW